MEFDIQKAFGIAEEAIKIYASIKALHTSDAVNSETGDAKDPAFSEYFEDGKTDELKKILIVASKIYCKDKGIKQNPILLASTIDDAVEILKSSYEVATGKIDADLAAQKIVDRIALRAISAAEIAIEEGVPILVDSLCGVMVASFPEMAPAVPFIKTVAQMLIPRIKELTRKGITALTERAKPYVAKGLTDLQKQNKKTSSKVRNWAFA